MKMRIREALPEDAGAIAELEKRCFPTPWTPETIEACLAAGEGRIFLAAEAEDGTLAGYMGLQHVLDEGYIDNVCTAPEFRRQGVARALIGEMIRRAGELGLSFLTLEARASNAPAIALYEKCGFKNMGLRPGYYERPPEDAVIMTLFLEEGQA